MFKIYLNHDCELPKESNIEKEIKYYIGNRETLSHVEYICRICDSVWAYTFSDPQGWVVVERKLLFRETNRLKRN